MKNDQRKLAAIVMFMSLIVAHVHAFEYHVSVKGNDLNKGTVQSPFRTIGKAAEVAYPGDVITVHEGTYREWVNPPRGGVDDDTRIIYRAAPGEKAEIKGSERITNWQPVEGHKGVWKVVLPNTFFGTYNPYIDQISGDWFFAQGRVHHTGEVFLNEKSLYEKESLEKVYNPQPMQGIIDPTGSTYTWYCEHTLNETTIYANFHKMNPNKELVEISARPTCFYPEKKGINYLTISGFHISQAATQWAPPTAHQIGMVATHWNKGWIIENNVISNSKCSGITLGKERNSGHNTASSDPTIDSAIHYIETTFNAIREGWNKENVGSHIVRNNIIFDCEQTGICGSMGASWSVIENNHIYNIWTKRQFDGFEIAGIKFHAAVDTHLEHNCIHQTGRGIWLDWMTQGTRLTRNLLYNNDKQDLFVEVSHGPFLVDNNILCSAESFLSQSYGGAFVQNLIGGSINYFIETGRYTPYFLPHTTEVRGLSIFLGGDMRFINNLFAANLEAGKKPGSRKYGLGRMVRTAYPVMTDGNVYYGAARPADKEVGALADSTFVSDIKIIDEGEKVYLSMKNMNLKKLHTQIVSTETLGKTKYARQRYENPDGSDIVLNTDYFGHTRSKQPVAGPMESLEEGENRIQIW